MEKPKIRFKGYQEDWEQRKLGDIASSFEYGLNAAAKEYDGENKYIRITDIDDNTHEFLTDNLTSPDIDLTGADNYKLTEGDILFARTGASVGKSYIYRNSDGLVYYAGFLIRARIKEEYDAEFVFQNTLTDRYNKYIAVTSQRSGQPGVNAQEYAEFEIEVPKKEEQTKIGTYFRNIDHLITLHQRKCEEMKTLKKYMLQKMFPQNGQSVPQIRFSGFTEDWEQRKLGELGTVQTCKRIFKEQTSEQGDIPFFKNGTIGLEPDSYISREVYEEFRRLYPYPEVGDTLISVVGSIGRTAEYIGKDEYFQDSNVVWLKTDGSINKKFLKTSYQVIKWLIEGSTVKHLYNDNILRSELVMPVSQIEQAKIAEFFEALDNLITLHQQKCDELRNIKKFMLQNMFI